MSEGDRQIARERGNIEEIKHNIFILILALKDSRVPWYTKLLIGVIAGYALSPIDLIPDFIPVLGLLDDLILLPLGIKLALKTIPDDVLRELKQSAYQEMEKRSRTAAIIIIVIWALVIFWIIKLIW